MTSTETGKRCYWAVRYRGKVKFCRRKTDSVEAACLTAFGFVSSEMEVRPLQFSSILFLRSKKRRHRYSTESYGWVPLR